MNRRGDRFAAALIQLLVITLFFLYLGTSLFNGSIIGQAAHWAPIESQSTPSGSTRERFDFLVRADFFAGFAGDRTAFERAMKVCEDTLARNSNHPEALVWGRGGEGERGRGGEGERGAITGRRLTVLRLLSRRRISNDRKRIDHIGSGGRGDADVAASSQTGRRIVS